MLVKIGNPITLEMQYSMKYFLPYIMFLFIMAAPKIFNEAEKKQDIPVKGYKLFWSDEFNGTTLDKTKWIYRGSGKRGDAYLSKSAVKVDGKGRLIIEVSQKADSVFTGMIATESIFYTRYGYFECRVKLAETPGVFPAFWLQSPLINNEKGGPEVNGAELDIFEYFPHTRKDAVAHTLHWGGYGVSHKVEGPEWGKLKKTLDGFHTIGLEWTPSSYATFVDGDKTFSGTSLISKVPQFIILSVGVDKKAAGPLHTKNLPDSFMIDYVRVYKKNSSLR